MQLNGKEKSVKSTNTNHCRENQNQKEKFLANPEDLIKPEQLSPNI
jgi:hypothetical protein